MSQRGGSGRGRGGLGSRGSRGGGLSSVGEVVKSLPEDTGEEGLKRGRGRGRPSAVRPTPGSSGAGGGGVSNSVMKKVESALPPDEKDGRTVTCADCGFVGIYRRFRLHNIQFHVNTAVTVEEKPELAMDHKYFSRKINEFKKLTKATVFACSRVGCVSTFKSTLGLAYHMNTCGRTAEELEASLIECEICHGKFTLPNMQWHRKTHEEKQVIDDSLFVKQIISGKSSKRKSALIASKSLKSLASSNKGNEDNSSNEGSCDESPVQIRSKKSEPKTNSNNVNNDFCTLSVKFLDKMLESESLAWDDPVRNYEDPFLNLHDNQFRDPTGSNHPESYLPTHRESVEFKYITDEGTSDFHRLTWFEGETIASDPPNCVSLHHSGGPVLSMSWHPSGKLLAVAVGRHCEDEIDVLNIQWRKACIQIYSCSSTTLSLIFVIGVEKGYASHIQWSTFCPDIMDSYIPGSKSCFDDIEIFCRIGYLAMNGEDSVVRIMSLRIEDLKLKPNYDYKTGYGICVYTKTPEICLQIDESAVDDHLGHAVKFDWHDKNKFMAVGYANGTIALFDLQTSSPLLVQSTTEESERVIVINPFWTFRGHRMSVRGLKFDPTNPRYLVSASLDRSMKVWDTHTRMERDTKRVGIALDMCWIRGWMHQMASFETYISNQSATYNYTRSFQIGCPTGKATCGELFNAISLDFHHGLTIQGTDDGVVSGTYYDVFWRDCDFERNRKKKNRVHLCSIKVDKSCYTEVSKNDFTVSVRKLKKSVVSTKAYQLGIDEDEGAYAAALEAKFGGRDIYDPLQDSESAQVDEVTMEEYQHDIKENRVNIKSEDGDSTSSKKNTIIVSANTPVKPRKKLGILPVYDVNISDVEPRVILNYVKERPNTSVPTAESPIERIEEYVRFQSYIRINKVAISPNGEFITVGYRNGLLSLIPGSFESVFAC